MVERCLTFRSKCPHHRDHHGSASVPGRTVQVSNRPTAEEKSSFTYGLLGHNALVLLSNRRRGTGGLFHGEGVGVPGRGVLVLLVGGLEPGKVEHGEWSEELVGNNTPGMEVKQS